MASAEPRETLGALWEWGWACMMDLGRAFFWRAPPSPPSITSWDSEDPGHLWSGFSPSTSALAGTVLLADKPQAARGQSGGRGLLTAAL